MNLVTEIEIRTRVKEDWLTLTKEYIEDDRAVLGVFVVDKALFGYAKELADIDTIAIIIPNLQEIAVGASPVKGAFLTAKGGGRIFLENFCCLFDDTYDKTGLVHQIYYSPYFYINPYYQKTFSQLLVQTEKQTEIQRFRTVQNAEDIKPELLAEILTQIIKQSLEINIGVQDELFNSLTKKEEEALIFILNTMGEEGNLSISEAIKASKISRPVFTSLLEKLDRYHGAKVKNQGVKGTYIQFYDHVLSAFEKD